MAPISSGSSPAVTGRGAPPPDDPAAQPVFVFGVTQRTGTHFLYDALVRHPDLRAALPVETWEGSWENHLLEYAHQLAHYAALVRESDRRNTERTEELLLESLGDGLRRFLAENDPSGDQAQRPVTKSPQTDNLDLFPQLFPGARMVVIVRDPAAVVASAVRTFGGSTGEWMYHWRDGVRRLRGFRSRWPEHAVVVRYEDLYLSTERTLRRVFAAIGADPDNYSYASVAAMPVRGSSELGHNGEVVTWEPRRRSRGFDPLARGGSLSRRDLARLRWLVADEAGYLGYRDYGGEPITARARVWCRALDYRTRLRRRGRRWAELAGLATRFLRTGRR